MITPAEAFGQRPIDEERFADDILRGKTAPHARVGTVAGIIAHYHVGIGGIIIHGRGVGKIRQVGILSEARGHRAIQVA